MTIVQKQWQLYILGYYGSSLKDIDGRWGKQSRAATLAFQKDFFQEKIAHDGIFGTSTAQKTMEVVDAIQDVVSQYAPQPLDTRYWGLAGKKTMEAVKAFQKAVGLPETGIADAVTRMAIQNLGAPEPQPGEPVPDSGTTAGNSQATGTFWDEIKYFTRNELRCKCGGRYCNGFPAEPQELLVRLAERARIHFGAPAYNVSCLRCKAWNSLQGGVSNSQHMYGEAMDIRIEGVSADKLLAFFLAQPEVRYAYKINATNVHFDIPKGKR